MKRYVAFLIALLALICSGAPAFAQHRFDVTIEGPWILYELKQFDGTNSMLLAIAPDVPGHHYPVFTTGDGVQINAVGIYCVAFMGGDGNDGTCKANGKPFPGPGNPKYDPTMLVQVKAYGGNLAWNNVKSNARAFLLPMPDSISNDGIDPTTTFRSGFATNSASSAPSAIGVQLHYDNGPAQFNLFECTQAPPSATCTNPKIKQPLDNSGTLRITIKAQEHADADDPCDYHVRMAHHSMLTFLDPTPLQQGRNQNQSVAYIESSEAPSGCRVCDPQQDSIPSSCAYGPGYGHVQMGNLRSVASKGTFNYMSDSVSQADLGTQLSSFNLLFKQLNLIVALDDNRNTPRNDGKRARLPAKNAESSNALLDSCATLDTLALDLKGKFPTLSQLTCVARGLEMRDRILERGRCSDKTSAASGGVDLPCDDARNSALAQSRGLMLEVQEFAKSATSGKDCRAAIMLLQTP
jgi:hypothetical protein